MTDQKAFRSWAGKCHYPNKQPFYLGTVVLSKDAMQHEIDKALLDLWVSISPHPIPSMVPIPGMVFFVPEKEEES